MAASADSGMRLMACGTSITAIAKRAPCKIVEIFVRAPASMFTLDRTISHVIGSPPAIPETMFPMPWAMSSRFGDVLRFSRSSRSTASSVRSACSEPTSAMVSAAEKTTGFVI